MDNLQVHKVARIQMLIEDRRCHLPFLPACSPDFSTIETFSKIKAFLRRAGARTRERLEEAITQALLTPGTSSILGNV